MKNVKKRMNMKMKMKKIWQIKMIRIRKIIKFEQKLENLHLMDKEVVNLDLKQIKLLSRNRTPTLKNLIILTMKKVISILIK